LGLESFNPNEPASPEFRKKIVSDFVKDVAEGSISLSLDYKGRRPEDIQMISDILAKLVNNLNNYVLGLTAGEEFDFLERQLFFCISVLRTYDAFKTNLSQSKIEDHLQTLESKFEESKVTLDKILASVNSGNKRKKSGEKKSASRKSR
jgi:hypothetical protein